MTQNGPNSGQPSQPWPGGDREEPYREPADPWGDQPDADHHGGGDLNTGWGGNPASMPPGAAGTSTGYVEFPSTGTYPPAPAGSPPAWAEPAPQRRGPGVPIVGLVVVLGVLICGGLAVTAWLLSRDAPTDTPTDRAATPTPAQSSAADVNPAPRSSNDARFVVKGQCVRNDGTAAKPDMTITACTDGTYQVLARVDGATTGEADAEAKCAKFKDYTKWYFYDSELDSLDFVLCLRDR